MPAVSGYTVNSRSSHARYRTGTGLARTVSGRTGAMAVPTVLRVSVARSTSSVRKQCTGRLFRCDPGALLADRGLGRLRRRHRAGPRRLGSPLVGVVEQLWRQLLPHVQSLVVGEHAEKDLCAHAIGELVVDRPGVQIGWLDAAEGVLDLAERFVATQGCRVVQHVGWQASAHYIYTIGGRFGGDFGALACEGETLVGDGVIEVLAHPRVKRPGASLVLLDHGTDGARDLGRPAQRLSTFSRERYAAALGGLGAMLRSRFGKEH